MLKTIVVPVDESNNSTRALPTAVRLARLTHAEVLLVHVVADKEVAQHGHALLDGLREHVPLDVHVRTALGEGDPAQAIIAMAQQERADLIVMATDHISSVDRWLNSSVTDTVLRRSGVPLLVVRDGRQEEWRVDHLRILVPLDGSQLAEAALAPAARLARAASAQLVLVEAIHSAEPEPASLYLDGLAQELEDEWLQVTTRTQVGDPAIAISQVAKQDNVDLIVMATHGRTGLARLAAGSVATRVMELVNKPVVLVRPNPLQQAHAELVPSYGQPFLPPLPWLNG